MNKTVGAVISAFVIIFCIVIALFCTVRIPAGYVGVIYNMNGGVAETTLSQGFHLVKPTQKVTTYTIGIEQSYLTSGSDGDSKGDESFEVPSNDGKGLTVDMTFTYRFDPDHVADVVADRRTHRLGMADQGVGVHAQANTSSTDFLKSSTNRESANLSGFST